MKNLNTFRKLFVAQYGRNDCGIACLAMVLNYAGRTGEAAELVTAVSAPAAGLSLFDLKELATGRGLAARCVQMDMQALSELSSPVILHTLTEKVGEHYVVCFGTVTTGAEVSYIIADPSGQVSAVSGTAIERRWPSRSALYFPDLLFKKPPLAEHPWLALLRSGSFGKSLLVIVPFLNLCAAMLGLTLSWMLQRGINDPLSDRKVSLLTEVFVLLLLTLLFRSLLLFIRQNVMIRLNGELSLRFHSVLVMQVISRKGIYGSGEIKPVKKGLADIAKIQHAVTAAVSVLFSEGSLIVLLISFLIYIEPVAGLINILYVILLTMLAYARVPAQTAQAAELHDLAAGVEMKLSEAIPTGGDLNDRLAVQLENHGRYLALAKNTAVLTGRINFGYECLGAFNVVAVFIFCILKVRAQELAYNSLMVITVLSYFITALLPKIYQVFPVIDEGAKLLKRYPDPLLPDQ